MLPSDRGYTTNIRAGTDAKTIGKLINQSFPYPDLGKELLKDTQSVLSNVYEVDYGTPHDVIFDIFKTPDKEEACIGKLLSVLKNCGLRDDDPRLRPMMDKLREIAQEREALSNETRDLAHWNLDRAQFKSCVNGSLVIITQALRNNLIVPSWSTFVDHMKEIFNKCKSFDQGHVATYIPQLARQDPEKWGVSICTVDGQRISFGDATTRFCFQSVSKAFNYAILASDIGADAVHSFVGQEPSGRLFNEICLDGNNKPHNPMVNSGAIIVTSLLKKEWNMADRFDYVLNEYKKLAGGEFIGFSNATFLSERETADRNFALSYFMKECKCFPQSSHTLRETLDFYFQLCSLEGTCESLSVMAATLANGGVCPMTGEKCVTNRPCRDVLSLMYSCGMYDYSGQFAFHVGLPAKSGVSGAMIVVIPNLMGICMFSPRLDKLGNSVRGVEFCKEMISQFKFHNYDSLLHAESQKSDPRKAVGEENAQEVVVLLFAAKNGDISAVRRWLMQGSNLEVTDYDGRTALHVAASEGHTELVKFLLNVAKVQHDPKDRWHRTPLDDAITFGFDECVRILEKARLYSALTLMGNNTQQKAVNIQQSSVLNSTFIDALEIYSPNSTI
uniref:glutaminase n=1 Tax=Plectus sambesii TaxID=2011161 RepID=A0A914X5I7_9BILA